MKHMRIRKRAVLVAGLLIVALFTSCQRTALQESQVQTQDAATQTEAAIQESAEETQSVVAQTEDAAQTLPYRAPYADQLAQLRAKFGAPEGDFEEQTGVLFADLMDWDADGTPEMLVLTHEIANDAGSFRLYVYGEKDGETVTLLNEGVGSSYGNLGSLLFFGVGKGASGEVIISVDNSHEYADLNAYYYTLSDGKVHKTVLSAQSSIGGWEGEGDNVRPADPDAYQIDGKTCSKEEFEALQETIYDGDVLGIWCQHIYDMRSLDAFLSGQSDSYAGGALLEAEKLSMEQIAWLPDVIFTVGN